GKGSRVRHIPPSRQDLFSHARDVPAGLRAVDEPQDAGGAREIAVQREVCEVQMGLLRGRQGQAHRRPRKVRVQARGRPMRKPVRVVPAPRRHEATLRRLVRAPLRAVRPWLRVSGSCE
ncbi:unnamed protein product, partial [Ectocarpus sp. 8 AP-2014]